MYTHVKLMNMPLPIDSPKTDVSQAAMTSSWSENRAWQTVL
jgi:hypothetical protein